ncbi:heat shock protein Ssz1 [Schizosaccharomyces osmophilus]|uniref:Heat shock protein Ssz1 n=1 Tax=Schizosaccharomyces osmophilus TaxID=2545709 RepID=A0AAF0AV90_9SCHI|nr:heat shock protein Ssz1 [Schizosaccharomyces osmophilus]WBW71735.1 heat shock protein Ssz1 [Schizosaccharomyces osmophilus]
MAESEEYKTVIGISFGNQNSSISFNRDGKTDVLANEEGNRQIPSILSYQGNQEYHGVQARGQLVRNADNSVTNFRDLIGKPYQEVTNHHCHYSASPVNVEGQVGFKVTVQEDEESQPKEKVVTAQEASTRHLQRLRESAQDFLGVKVDGCVMSVPVYFTEEQRKALEAAAVQAGLPILQLIHDPAAILLALMYSESVLIDKTVVVANFGANRSEVSVVSIKGGMMTVLSTAHDENLGGEELTDVLVKYFAKEFEKKNGINPLQNARSAAKLREQCELTKRVLSNNTNASAAVDSLAEGIDFHATLNRLRFELAAAAPLNRMAQLVEQAVKKANLEPFDVSEVVLAGGASNTPKLTSLMEGIFPEQTAIRSTSSVTPLPFDASELVAVGSGVQASLVGHFEASDIASSMESAIVEAPHLTAPIGINEGGKFVTLLDAETALPTRKVVEVVAPKEGGAYIPIFEAERSVKITKAEPEPLDEEEALSDEEEEEPEEIKERIAVPKTLLATINIPDVSPNSKIELVLQLDVEGKLTATARPKDGKGSSVRGSA